MNTATYLNTISEEQLTRQIEGFRKIDLKTISDEDLANAIISAISLKLDDGSTYASFIPVYSTILPITRLYRVRTLAPSDTLIPLKGMKVEVDAWSPPEHVVENLGRLNRVNESLLYVTESELVAVDELKIEDERFFSLITYEVNQEIKVTRIGITSNLPEYTPAENSKIDLINKFLTEEFTKDVRHGEEHLYRVSEMIAKHLFDLPPRDVQDAWMYQSIAFKKFPGLCNLCFRPEIAREVLDLVGVRIAKVTRSDTGYSFLIKCIASGFYEDGTFKYYGWDSNERRAIFPDMN